MEITLADQLLYVQNELAVLEFIHCLVETLDRYFLNVCELDLMFNIETVSLAFSTSCFGSNIHFYKISGPDTRA